MISMKTEGSRLVYVESNAKHKKSSMIHIRRQPQRLRAVLKASGLDGHNSVLIFAFCFLLYDYLSHNALLLFPIIFGLVITSFISVFLFPCCLFHFISLPPQ